MFIQYKFVFFFVMYDVNKIRIKIKKKKKKTMGKRLEDFRLNSVRVCARKCDRENDGGCARSNLLIDVSSACLLY